MLFVQELVGLEEEQALAMMNEMGDEYDGYDFEGESALAHSGRPACAQTATDEFVCPLPLCAEEIGEEEHLEMEGDLEIEECRYGTSG